MKSRNTPPLHSGNLKQPIITTILIAEVIFRNSYISIHFITRNGEQQILFKKSHHSNFHYYKCVLPKLPLH